jgi:hypothetical protein
MTQECKAQLSLIVNIARGSGPAITSPFGARIAGYARTLNLVDVSAGFSETNDFQRGTVQQFTLGSVSEMGGLLSVSLTEGSVELWTLDPV